MHDIHKRIGCLADANEAAAKLVDAVFTAYVTSPVKSGPVCWGNAHLAGVVTMREVLGIKPQGRLPQKINSMVKRVVDAIEWCSGKYKEPTVAELRTIDSFIKYDIADWMHMRMHYFLIENEGPPIKTSSHKKARYTTSYKFVSNVRTSWPDGLFAVDHVDHMTLRLVSDTTQVVIEEMLENESVDFRFEGHGKSAKVLWRRLKDTGDIVILANDVADKAFVPVAIPLRKGLVRDAEWCFANLPTESFVFELNLQLP